MRVHESAGLTPAEAIWFAPAFARLGALGTDPDSRLRGFFTAHEPIHVGRAPGRLDVMGGIADYSGSRVLELPLERATFALVQRQQPGRCDVGTRRTDGWRFFSIDMERLVGRGADDAASLARWFSGHDDHWASYVAGVVHLCGRRVTTGADSTLRGLRILIDSTVPQGRGVSSSAALEVATMAAVNAAFGVSMAAPDIAHACQWVENHVVGAPCGIMDQMTSACGRRGRLLRLLCQPDIVEGFVDLPASYGFYGIDSGVQHAVAAGAYARVRTAAFMGYRMIAELAGLSAALDEHRVRIDDPGWKGYLTNIPVADFTSCFESHLPERMTGAEFLDRYGGITDPITRVRRDVWYPVRQATAHPVREHERVTHFARLLAELPRPDAAADLGRLMAESHASYSACGLGSERTDRLVALVAGAGTGRSVFGAKITGGGSGGTVAILGSADAGQTVRAIAARYSSEIGQTVDVFAGSGPGAGETGVVIIRPDSPSSSPS